MRKIYHVYADNELVNLQKDIFGWHVVHPIKKDETQRLSRRNVNWKNLISGGNWYKLIILGIVIFIILGCVYEYSTAISALNECLEKTVIRI